MIVSGAGRGWTHALFCDFRIAAESAPQGDTSLKFGLIPDEGGAYLFPKFIGLERALKVSLFSEVYAAYQASSDWSPKWYLTPS